jgi:hypothetical protein
VKLRKRKNSTSGPSKYRRAISLPTLKTSLSFTADRQTLQNYVLAANWDLEIRMQLVEIAWHRKLTT